MKSEMHETLWELNQHFDRLSDRLEHLQKLGLLTAEFVEAAERQPKKSVLVPTAPLHRRFKNVKRRIGPDLRICGSRRPIRRLRAAGSTDFMICAPLSCAHACSSKE
jgi:hypothetical protein